MIKTVKYPLLGSAYITNVQIINIVISVVLMIGLSLLVNRTMIGMAMRASKSNKEAVALMGVNVNRVIGFTFVLGTALGGRSRCPKRGDLPADHRVHGNSAGPQSLRRRGSRGIGSIEGAMVGGVLMGLAEQFAIGLLPSDFGVNHIDFTPLAEGVSFAILIIMLLLRPQGIFGEPPQDKV
jgi:branched-chain amino acid transport system permease protein